MAESQVGARMGEPVELRGGYAVTAWLSRFTGEIKLLVNEATLPSDEWEPVAEIILPTQSGTGLQVTPLDRAFGGRDPSKDLKE